MNLEQARGFVAVVEHGSIAAAAASLGMSRPTLSRHLAAFEVSLGLAVLHRSTRAVGPTVAGQELYEALAPLLVEAQRVEARFTREAREVTGWLRVSVPPALAGEVAAVLRRLQRVHPDLAVQLSSSPERVDLRDGRVDVALRAGRLADPDLVQRLVGRRSVRAWASPDYLARHGPPTDVADLADHRLLRSLAPDGRPRRAWPLRAGGHVPVTGHFVSDDQSVLCAAAEAGEGIALLDVRTAAAGELQEVLPERVGTELELHAVTVRRTLQPARVRAFVDAVVAAWDDVRG